MTKHKVLKIMELAFDVSNTTHTDVFIRYSPHCHVLDVSIYKLGWKSSIEFDYAYDYSYMISLDETEFRDIVEIHDNLNDVISILDGLLHEHTVTE